MTENKKLTIDETIAEEKELHELYKERYERLGVKGCKKRAEEHEQLAEWLEELKEYEDAEEQGLLLWLPCKVGTPVYMIAQDCGGDTLDCRYRDCEGCSYLYSFVEENAFDTYMVDDIGKTVFLTKEEAEQALQKMKEGAE